MMDNLAPLHGGAFFCGRALCKDGAGLLAAFAERCTASAKDMPAWQAHAFSATSARLGLIYREHGGDRRRRNGAFWRTSGGMAAAPPTTVAGDRRCTARRSGEFLHHDPVALDFVQIKLDRRDRLGRPRIGGFDRTEDFTLGAQQDDAPAAFHPAGELARRVFGGAAARWHRRENRASRRQCLIVNRPSTIHWQRSPTVQCRRAEIGPWTPC